MECHKSYRYLARIHRCHRGIQTMQVQNKRKNVDYIANQSSFVLLQHQHKDYCYRLLMCMVNYTAVSSCCPLPPFSLGGCTLEPSALVLTSTSAATGCSSLVHWENSMYSAAASKVREMVSTSLLKSGLCLGLSFQHSSIIA